LGEINNSGYFSSGATFVLLSYLRSNATVICVPFKSVRNPVPQIAEIYFGFKALRGVSQMLLNLFYVCFIFPDVLM